MSAADEAYRAAEAAIAEAKRTGAERLSFDDDSFRALDRLPPGLAALHTLRGLDLGSTQVSDLSPLAGMMALETLVLDNTQVSDLSLLAMMTRLVSLRLISTKVSDLSPLAGIAGLRMLALDNTQVSDLSPLAGLTGLGTLRLGNTQVQDVRPLRGLRKLADDPEFVGLTFRGISAAADPRIAEIAAIGDAKERAAALFALLDAGWEPQVVQPEPLEPDPLLRSILVDEKLEIAADPPTEEERRDRVKAILHDRLRDKAGTLAALAGNRFPRLANRARALATLLDKPFDELDLLSVHLEIEGLEDRRETGAEEGEAFTDEVRQAIADVTRAGPGLTIGHPDVDLMLDRRRMAREEVVPEAEDAAHRRLSEAVMNDPEAHGPNSRAMEELLQRVADEAASRVLLRAKHRNLVWAIATFAAAGALDVGSNVAAGLIADALGPNVTMFVRTNYAVLSEVAATYGRGVLVWFQQTVGPVLAGIDPTVIRPFRKSDWRK
jgi:hypothetical protein